VATRNPDKKRLLSLAGVVTASLLLTGVLFAGCGGTEPQQGAQSAGTLLNTITVGGTGEVTTLPDEATLQVGVENDGATAAAALDANSKDMQKVLDRLAAEGIAADAIETSNVVVYPNYYYDDKTGQQKTTGYRAQNTITITFHDLSIIGDIYAAVVEAGADNVYGPSWRLSDDNAAVATALTRAIAEARSKAEAIAADQGVQLGEAIVISESSVSVPYPMYDTRQEAAAGTSVTPPPITPQNINVTASVTVTYPMTR